MNAEFQWWLLILGVVIGGGLVYLVLADLGSEQIAADADEASANGRSNPGPEEPATAQSTGSATVEPAEPDGAATSALDTAATFAPDGPRRDRRSELTTRGGSNERTA